MKSLAFVLLIFSTQAFSQSIDPYIKAIAQARVEVESNIERTPYQSAQHATFKQYFLELEDLIKDLKASSKLVRKLQSYIGNDLGSVCKEVFLEKALWNELVKRCTKNRFFLCAEEVNAFGVYKDAFKEHLTEAQKEEFTNNSNCSK
jgi:hypothetical protein